MYNCRKRLNCEYKFLYGHDIRKIYHHTLNILGTGLILIHNHPSGNINPSEADITITKKILEAGKLFDIAVLDHLIIANGYYSFADEGQL